MNPDRHADIVVCDHPSDAIMWNPWNEVTQCHRCGFVTDRTPMPSGDAEHRTPHSDGYGTRLQERLDFPWLDTLRDGVAITGHSVMAVSGQILLATDNVPAV